MQAHYCGGRRIGRPLAAGVLTLDWVTMGDWTDYGEFIPLFPFDNNKSAQWEQQQHINNFSLYAHYCDILVPLLSLFLLLIRRRRLLCAWA